MSAVTAVDGVYVGHGIGSDGIAAINICIPLLMLFTGVGLMVGAGVSVVASIHLSRGKIEAARINVSQALLFVTLVGLVPSILMMAYPSGTARLLGAFGIACYYTPFVFMVGNAIAQSAQPIISYNFGLGHRNRVRATERIALLTAVVCGVVLTAAFSLFPDILVGLFINTENPAARMAIEGFPYFSAAFVFFIFNLTVIGYYQSLEKMRHATVLALLRGFIFLIPSFILLPKAIGAHGIWLALCFSELLTTLTIVVIYGAGVLKNTRFSDY